MGTPSTVTPSALRSSCSIRATIWGSSAKRARTGPGSCAARTTARCSHEARQRRTSAGGGGARAVPAALAPTADVAGGLGVERGGDGVHELARTVEQEALTRARLRLLSERLAELRLRLG